MVELSLTVPITNSMAFLFTVLGEWYVEGKVISGRELFHLLSSILLGWLVKPWLELLG